MKRWLVLLLLLCMPALAQRLEASLGYPWMATVGFSFPIGNGWEMRPYAAGTATFGLLGYAIGADGLWRFGDNNLGLAWGIGLFYSDLIGSRSGPGIAGVARLDVLQFFLEAKPTFWVSNKGLEFNPWVGLGYRW